jgi:hypothetical protein
VSVFSSPGSSIRLGGTATTVQLSRSSFLISLFSRPTMSAQYPVYLFRKQDSHNFRDGWQCYEWIQETLTLILLMWRIGWASNSITIYSYIQQDATLHSLFISGNCSTCFGWYFHPSSGAHPTVSTASGISHTVTAICRYRGRVGTGLSVLWVAYAEICRAVSRYK